MSSAKEEESINFLIRFNNARETFPSVIRVLSILLKTVATSAGVERMNSKELVLKAFVSSPVASYAQM